MDHHTEESSPIHVNHSASVLLLQCEEFCFPLREPLCFGLLSCCCGRCCANTFVHERAVAYAPPTAPTVKARSCCSTRCSDEPTGRVCFLTHLLSLKMTSSRVFDK